MTRIYFCVAFALCLLARQVRAEDDTASTLTVRAVVQMALKVARHTAPGRAEELGKRARLAGLVPQLRLGARRGLQQDQSLTSTLSDDRTNASLGDDLTLEAGLTFQLDRLVFAPEQVRLLAVERWLASDRRKLVEDVVRLFFRRARLLHERKSAAVADPSLDADIAELEALLDAYTDGAFSEALAKLAKAAKPAASPVASSPSSAVSQAAMSASAPAAISAAADTPAGAEVIERSSTTSESR